MSVQRLLEHDQADSANAEAMFHDRCDSPSCSTRTIVLLGPDLKAVSGVSTHLNQLLRSQVKQHFRFLHFRVGSEGRKESLLEKIRRFAWSPWQLMTLLSNHRDAIVHINTSMNPKGFWRDLVYLLVSRSCGCKVVYQVHGGELPQDFSANNALFRALLRGVLKIPSVIVLLGEFQRHAYHAFSPTLTLRVAANAIEVDRLDAGVRSAQSGHPLRLVFIGRLAEAKGIFEIVEAVSLLRDEGIDVELAIAGSGPDEQRLRWRIAELRVDDRIELRGAVFGVEKDELWMESDVFVFPTYHREGLPYALLESMAAGAVPISCPVGAIPEVMEDQKEGLFVQPGDARALAAAVRRLHEDRKELGRLGKAARERVLENHNLTRLGDRFRGIYSEL